MSAAVVPIIAGATTLMREGVHESVDSKLAAASPDPRALGYPEPRNGKEGDSISIARAGGHMDQVEVEAIIAETRAFVEAMNAGDAALAASFYTEDGTRVGGFGDTQHGRKELEAAYVRLLHEVMPGARLRQARGTVRMLTQDLGVWQGGLEIAVPGSEAPLRGHVVQVMKKVEGRWLILEGHPKLFPTPPPTTEG
jgi:uncharacterized protein (TIGR02246 family)